MNFFDLMVKSAGKAALPKRGGQKTEDRIQNTGRHPTPIVTDRGHRQPKTKRSKRRNKVRAFEVAMRNKFSHRGRGGNIDADTAALMAREMRVG